MTIQIIETFNYLSDHLSAEEKKYLHFRSINNFMYHFPNLSLSSQAEVENLLQAYFDEVNKNNNSYTIDNTTDLVVYLSKVGVFYKRELGFKQAFPLRFAIFWGLGLDILLLLGGLLKSFYYIPIVTLLFISRYIYLLRFERQGKLYGTLY